MATQNAPTDATNRPAEILTTMTDAMRTGGEKASAGNREVAECALECAKENVDAMFRTLQTMAAAKSPLDFSKLYTQFLTKASERALRQAKVMGEIVTRSSKDAFQPIGEMIESATKAVSTPTKLVTV